MAGRHVPQRTCIACRTNRPKREMVRVVRDAEGRIAIDPTGKRSGRGAYLCRTRLCWETALRKQALAKALKAELAVSDRVALEQFASSLPEEETTVSS